MTRRSTARRGHLGIQLFIGVIIILLILLWIGVASVRARFGL